MRIINKLNIIFLLLILSLTISCSSGPEIREASMDETVTGSDWSAKDLKVVSTYMLNSLKKAKFLRSISYRKNKPAWMLAKSMEKNTDEHIDTRVMMEKIRTKLINQGVAEFIDDKALEGAMKQLRLQSSDLFDATKASKLGKLIGAKFILRGRMTNIRKKNARTDINYINIILQAVNIETSKIVWTDEKEITRYTKKSSSR
jgi:hypothetical protein